MRSGVHYACVTFRRSRRGRWSWHWQEKYLGHVTTEQAFGFESRPEAAIAFCLTADARGFADLAQQVSDRELGACENG